MPTRTRTLEDLAGNDVIDSRDLIARLEELNELDQTWNPEDEHPEDPMTDDEREELNALRAICDEGESSISDWFSGVALIRDSYFTEYAQELADDIGAINRDAQWPLDCIDWDRAAEALKQDYGTVEIEGYTYYGRS